MDHLHKYQLTKQALLGAAAGGGLIGALQAPEDLRGEGALRGAGIGVGTGIGAGLGSLGGALGGGLLAALLHDKGIVNDRGAMATILLSNLLGIGAGGYGGYRLGKNLMWFDDETKPAIAKAKKDYAESKKKKKKK